jgi:hypothetical protein
MMLGQGNKGYSRTTLKCLDRKSTPFLCIGIGRKMKKKEGKCKQPLQCIEEERKG